MLWCDRAVALLHFIGIRCVVEEGEFIETAVPEAVIVQGRRFAIVVKFGSDGKRVVPGVRIAFRPGLGKSEKSAGGSLLFGGAMR